MIESLKFHVVVASVMFFTLVALPGGSASQELTSEQLETTIQARAVLETHCKTCHSGKSINAGFDIDDRKGMLEDEFLVPGDVEASLIYEQVEAGLMPPGELPKPNKNELAALKKWIEEGGLSVPAGRVPRDYVGEKSVIAAISKDIFQLDNDDIRFTRYLTLAHLYNDPSTSDEQLRYVRAAVSKVANSLSSKPKIAVPRVVDEGFETILAIDIRDYGWSEGDWKEVQSRYPYGLKLGGNAAQKVYDNCGTLIPAIRADWFVNTVTRPELYHLLLDIPHNARTLERELGVNVKSNFLNNQLKRAAFSGKVSGVSDSNRMVERHDSNQGYYWKSYDMLPLDQNASRTEKNKRNFTVAPLGPSFEGIGRQRGAFKHDGGEIIYSLPNGLQAYMLRRFASAGNFFNKTISPSTSFLLTTAGTCRRRSCART